MKIQLTKIRPNPKNPRRVITKAMIDIKAASMSIIGLLDALKVRALTPAERQADPSHEYEVVSGHIRLLAAIQLGWQDIDIVVLDLPPEKLMAIAIADNQGQQMFWLDVYESIGSMMAADPKLTQKQAAQAMAIDPSTASHAIKALSLLNGQARAAILETLKNSGGWQVSEAVIIAMTGLARNHPSPRPSPAGGEGVKLSSGDDNPSSQPSTAGGEGVNLADQALMEQAIKVVIDRKMTEPQARKLVEWVKKGNSPDTFPEDGKLSGQNGSKQQNYDPSDPYAGLWEPLPKSFQIYRTQKGYKMSLSADAAEAPLMAYAAMAWKTALKAKRNGGVEERKNGGVAAKNEFMDALPSLLEKASQMDVSQVPAPVMVDGSRIMAEANQPVKQASPATGSSSETKLETKNEKLETMKNLITGIATSGRVGEIIKSKPAQAAFSLAKKGLKKLFKNIM